jgi:hypothetical protein
MKRIIVTPAGRKRYLKILLQNLIKCKNEFDHWDIWINTKNQEDIDFILEIEKNYDFITTIQATSEINTEWPGASIHQFFKGCIDETIKIENISFKKEHEEIDQQTRLESVINERKLIRTSKLILLDSFSQKIKSLLQLLYYLPTCVRYFALVSSQDIFIKSS